MQLNGPERFINTCEWCGKPLSIWGKFALSSGAGIRLVLCATCAENYNPTWREMIPGYKDEGNNHMEMVPCDASAY